MVTGRHHTARLSRRSSEIDLACCGGFGPDRIEPACSSDHRPYSCTVLAVASATSDGDADRAESVGAGLARWWLAAERAVVLNRVLAPRAAHDCG